MGNEETELSTDSKPPPISLVKAVEDFSKSVIAVTAQQDAVEELGRGYLANRKRAQRAVVRDTALAISLLINLVLTFFVASNAGRISDIQNRTSDSVLCPLYVTLVDQINNTTNDELAKLTEKQRRQYEAQASAIMGGYKVLNCR